jgi:tRNA nucleotidyltransferase/poly(A) polymerase
MVKETKIGEIVDFNPNNLEHLDDSKYEVVEWKYERDGRKPSSVEIGTIHDDAMRRDLTINSLYENPITGEILDPTSKGLSDIKNRVIRFVGNPEDRIREDYLRLWRALRFKQKLSNLGFDFDTKTKKVLRTMFKEAYENSNPERVREEIEKMI